MNPSTIPGLQMDLTFNEQEHDWVQEGNHIHCSTCPQNSQHGTILPVGLMLIGKRGAWELVPERGTPRHDDIIKPKSRRGPRTQS